MRSGACASTDTVTMNCPVVVFCISGVLCGPYWEAFIDNMNLNITFCFKMDPMDFDVSSSSNFETLFYSVIWQRSRGALKRTTALLTAHAHATLARLFIDLSTDNADWPTPS